MTSYGSVDCPPLSEELLGFGGNTVLWLNHTNHLFLSHSPGLITAAAVSFRLPTWNAQMEKVDTGEVA